MLIRMAVLATCSSMLLDPDADGFPMNWCLSCRSHVAVTYSLKTKTAKIFLNGVEVASCESVTNTFSGLPEMTDALIGTGVAVEEPYIQGRVASFFFYTRQIR